MEKKLRSLVRDLRDDDTFVLTLDVGDTSVALTLEDEPSVSGECVVWNWGAVRIDAIRCATLEPESNG